MPGLFKYMDIIGFWTEGDGDAAVVNMKINSRPLLEMVREVELPYALLEGHPNIAGKYIGLPRKLVAPPSKHFLGQPRPLYTINHCVQLFMCECREPGCWPLFANLRVMKHEVIWQDFKQPHRGPRSKAGHWRYDKLGPFCFDIQQYVAALIELADSAGASWGVSQSPISNL